MGVHRSPFVPPTREVRDKTQSSLRWCVLALSRIHEQNNLLRQQLIKHTKRFVCRGTTGKPKKPCLRGCSTQNSLLEYDNFRQ